MWVPLAILSVFAILCAGLPNWHVLENFLTYGIPEAAATGEVGRIAHRAHELHGVATLVASAAALFGAALACGVYWFGALDPMEGIRQFPGIYNLLVNKWYFDEVYRYLLVRPTMILARVALWIDARIIDGLIDGSAQTTVEAAHLDGQFDKGVVDGLVNLVGDATYGGGTSLRHVQTGWLRGYVIVIALGSVALFALGALLFS
jgi:NADH:ubiquinone oxidoreductase subunit 5 (subunit L)/multisubunit Na+/H+ antiporter MnhA subunit